MRAICKMVTGDVITVDGEVVKNIVNYFSGRGNGTAPTMPLGWVSTIGSTNQVAINFNHVVHIEFKNV